MNTCANGELCYKRTKMQYTYPEHQYHCCICVEALYSVMECSVIQSDEHYLAVFNSETSSSASKVTGRASEVTGRLPRSKSSFQGHRGFKVPVVHLQGHSDSEVTVEVSGV